MVCQRCLRVPRRGNHIAHGRDVRIEITVELGVAQVGERLHLEALVAVEDVDREQPADVGAVNGDAAGPPGIANLLHLEPATVPVADRVDPVQLRCTPVLAEEVDVVSLAGERLGQAGVIDVGSGPAQQVAVKDQDAHRTNRIARGGRP